MTPTEFVKTIYLGDRYCLGILIDSINNLLKIQVNEISRIRDKSGIWNFYNDENIPNGYLVFFAIEQVQFLPNFVIPNDQIEIKECQKIVASDDKYIFKVVMLSVDENGITTEMEVLIKAKGLYLLNPLKPNEMITN